MHTLYRTYPARASAVVLLLAILCLTAWTKPAMAGPLENLASRATITSCCHYSDQYLPKFVADGKLPDALGSADLSRAWAVNGNVDKLKGWLKFEWPEAVTVAEVIYYGRTAWMLTECWKDYEVLVDGTDKPVARGRFEMRHGPQRIAIKPVRTRTLTLKFPSSYGGLNPGASEVQIFSAPAPAKLLLSKPAPESSPELVTMVESGELGFTKLLLVQRHTLNPTHVYTYHNEGFRGGGGLHVLTPGNDGGSLQKLVDSPEGQILDCDLSYDGTEALFSWRKSAAETYQVYRIKIDGTGLTRVTSGDDHNFNACWLPDGGIGFLSTRRPAFAYCWTSPVGILHRMNADGSDVVKISANYLNDFTPCVTNDGQLIYGRWEYVDRPAIPIQSLWTINPDGTNLAVFYGNRVLSPATFIEPRPIPGSTKILCTMTAHNGPCRGAIGIIDPALGVNAQSSIENLTPEVDIGKVDKGSGNHVRGPYESPYPIDDTYFLMSRQGTIVLRDYEGSRQADLLRPQGPLGFYSAQPIRSRVRPPVHPSSIEKKTPGWATVFMQDATFGLEPHVARGDVKQICIVQEIEKSELADVKYRAFGFQFPVVSCGATYAPKKVWGYAKVAADGSAHFKVPAEVPIYFMALDKHGRAVQRMRSFTHFMSGEVQSCVGCHDSRNQVMPAVHHASSVDQRPQELTPPEWGVTGFSYARIVQPVLDEHCVSCHDAPSPAGGVDLSGDKTDYFNVSYEVLARQGERPGANPYTKWIPTYNGQEANILEVTPKAWGSPASALADLVLSGHPDEDGKPRIDMDDASRRRLFAWIDLNVPYYGTSRSNFLDRRGCRQMVPPDLDSVLQKVARSRCASCHQADGNGNVRLPRKSWVRIDRPHFNNFLLAPLAKTAGGTEACGKAIFESRRDEDYQAILATFSSIKELLDGTPRMDMARACGK